MNSSLSLLPLRPSVQNPKAHIAMTLDQLKLGCRSKFEQKPAKEAKNKTS